MSATTERVLERVLVLLGARPPHLATARKQLDELIAKPPCGDETAGPRKAVVRLLDRLAMPILEGHPETRLVAEGLRERLQQSGSLSGSRAQLEKASSWIVRPPQVDTGREALPATLSGRLLTALRLYGESVASIGGEASRLMETLSPGDPPWPEVETLLQRMITHAEPIPPSRLDQERDQLRQAIRRGLEALQAGHAWAPDDASGMALGEPDAAALLRQRGREAKQRARSLAARIADSKEMAERLKSRLRQLEEAVSQARIEGFMDPLTGLPDRFAFTAQLKRHLERAVHLNEPFSLALVHLHHFAPLVTRLGHEGETRLMDGLVRQLRRHLRDDEYLARLSVERLVILFPRSDQSRAEVAIRDIERMLTQTRFLLDEQGIDLDAYCGTVALGPGMSGQEMLELTDRVAAVARREGGPREPRLNPERICPC
ncbi:MAG: GGDEF domain-containing protein [Magnetococcales bacterium]|nr:GGDEF domain-containing protein [Magnetococcales bacterium]